MELKKYRNMYKENRALEFDDNYFEENFVVSIKKKKSKAKSKK